VVDSTEINAFALPGGFVYITRGLLAYLNSEAELAAVLGHEIGHITVRHGVRQQTSSQPASIGARMLSILLPELAGAGLGQLVALLGTALLRGYGREH
jgi:predicted Zn-dependent protease